MKKLYLLIIAIISIFIIIFGINQLNNNGKKSEVANWSGKIYPGITVENIDLSGKTATEAEDILNSSFRDLLIQKSLTVTAGQKKYVLDFTSIDASYNIQKTVAEALNYGKDQSISKQYSMIKKAEAKNFPLTLVYSKDSLSSFVNTIKSDTNVSAKNATISVENGKISVVDETDGQSLDSNKLNSDIVNALNNLSDNEINITAALNTTKPNVTASQLSKVNAKIGTYTTYFNNALVTRVSNIKLASRTVSGYVVLPGKSFSFNTIVGERTTAKGYQEAPVIIDSQLGSGLGGGICQVSTTMFNALLRTPLPYSSIARLHHSLPSHYVPLGMDATVDYASNTDFKFTNTFDYPIIIEALPGVGKLTMNVYSNDTLATNTYKLVQEKLSVTQPKITYIDDATLAAGTKIVEKTSSIGYVVNVYREVYLNGALVKKEFLYKDTYKVVNGIIRRGTKAKQTTPSSSNSPTPSVNPSPSPTPTSTQ